VALLTGSGRGIGLAIARALSDAGAAVAIQDLDLDVATHEVESIKKSGGRAIALDGDIRDPSEAAAWIDRTVEQLGGLHILVNNAAIQSSQPWLDVKVELLEEQFRANVITPIVLSQRVVPIFRAQRWGRIVNIGSIQQVKGVGTMLPYSLTKSSLATLTRVLARETVKDGITVNIIAPGFFRTLRNHNSFDTEEKAKHAGDWVPMGRAGEPQDCIGAALLLCSDAGSYITGQSIFVDGGMSA
jgi:NAD(P)-dependent dehydrogenase (short-subunit alcohol dehydrogenase family)